MSVQEELKEQRSVSIQRRFEQLAAAWERLIDDLGDSQSSSETQAAKQRFDDAIT